MKIPPKEPTIFRNTQRLLVAATLVLVCVPSGSAGAASDILDQSQPSWNYFTKAFVGAPVGQIFTAGTYGMLDRVSVELENYAPNPVIDPVVVSIQTVKDGIPSGKQIANGTIPLSAIPPAGSPGWVDVSFTGAVVSAGTQYALVLSAAGAGECLWYFAGDVYPRGYAVTNNQGVWYSSPSFDATFQTYVIPDIPDQAQTSQHRNNLVGGGNKVAQIFTTGQYGLLDRVSVELAKYSTSPATGDITVDIYAVSGRYPSGIPIAGGTIPLSAIPPEGSPAWVDVAIKPVIVSPGTQYALVLSLDGGGYVRWQDTDNGGSYPSGNELTGYPTGWSTMNDSYDTAFKTYVVPDLLDQAAVVGGTFLKHVAQWQQIGQTFTAGVTGTLDRVSVYIQSGGGGSGSCGPVAAVGVDIYTQDVSTRLGSGLIPVTALPGSPSWVDVSISGAVVTRGTQYALILSSPGCSYWFEADIAYGGGYAIENNNGEGWKPSYAYATDMLFKTYVLPYIESLMWGSGPGPEIRLRASANPSALGQQVTYTATVDPVPDGGTVLFQDNGTDITGCAAQTVDTISGAATCSVTYNSLGSHTITARFSGHGSFEPSMTASFQDVQYAVGRLYKVRDQYKAGSTIPIKLALLNASGRNLSSVATQIQALCVVATPIPSTDPCASAPYGFNWSTGTPPDFSYSWELGPGGGYQFNVKTTTELPVDTYHLLFRATGESDRIYHPDAGVTFNVSR